MSHSPFSAALSHWRREMPALLHLAGPMVVGAVLEALVPFINVFMLARLGASMVAAAALSTLLFSTVMMVFWGVFSASSTLIAQRYGEKNTQAIGELVVTSCWFAVGVGVVAAIALWNAGWLLAYLGQTSQTIEVARGYFHGLALAIVADFSTYALFSFFQGIMQSAITLWLSILYVPINIGVNYCLVFGGCGLAPLGIAGIGYGTAVAFWLLSFFCVFFILFNAEAKRYFGVCLWPTAKALWALLRVGVPLGVLWTIALVFELVVAALMGHMSAMALALFQLVRQWVDVFFIVSYCLARALGIKIAEAIGQGQRGRVKAITQTALGLNVICVTAAALVLWNGDQCLLSFDWGKAVPILVQQQARLFFRLATVWMVCDTLRTVLFGVLLGLQDTWYLLWTGALCWLLLGIPLAVGVSKLYPQTPSLLWWVCALTEILNVIFLVKRYQKKW